jgi:hypothetical protein
MGMAAPGGVLAAKPLRVFGTAAGACEFIYSLQTRAEEDGIPHSQYAVQNQTFDSYHKKLSP